MTSAESHPTVQGSVEIVFDDVGCAKALRIFRATFGSEDRLARAWELLPPVDGYSAFRALLRDAHGDVVAARGIDYRLIERIMTVPVAVSLNRARTVASRAA